jgi:hypothetical protein
MLHGFFPQPSFASGEKKSFGIDLTNTIGPHTAIIIPSLTLYAIFKNQFLIGLKHSTIEACDAKNICYSELTSVGFQADFRPSWMPFSLRTATGRAFIVDMFADEKSWNEGKTSKFSTVRLASYWNTDSGNVFYINYPGLLIEYKEPGQPREWKSYHKKPELKLSAIYPSLSFAWEW